MRVPRRSVVVALVPAGAIAGHVLGYLLAGEDAALHGGHSHLRPAAWVAAGATAAVLACLALARPGREPRPVRLASLVTAQVVLFGVVEAGEHLVAGHGPVSIVVSPSFRWGVLAQLLSGAVLVLAARLARASGVRVRSILARRRPRPPAPVRSAPSPRAAVLPRSPGASSVKVRAPPRRLASA